VEGEVADGRLIAVGEPTRGLEWLAGNAVLGTVLGQPVDPVDVGLVRPLDWDAKLLGKYAGAAAMIDVAVRQQDLLDRHSRLRHRRLEPRQVAAGIDEGAAHRRGAPQQGAILLQRRHWNDRRSEGRFAHFGGSAGAVPSAAD